MDIASRVNKFFFRAANGKSSAFPLYRIVKGASGVMRLVDLLFDPMDFWEWRLDVPVWLYVMLP